MRIGVFHFPTDYGIGIAELARALEDRGFESLFVCEHTHIPTSRRSPFPGGGALPKRYAHTHDPFVALSFAAAATRRLLLGTGICLVPQHDPIVTAKSVASLDLLSGGRFLFGIGAGWNAEEMENHGTRFETRFQVMRERVLAMKALWTREEAEFHGRFVDFDPVWCWPKPAQRPHPPILLGGETDHTLRRVVAFCDGWIPRAGRGDFDPQDAMARLRRAAEAAGRDPASLPVTVFRGPTEPAALAAYREAGIARVLLDVPDLDRDAVLRLLDGYVPLLAAAGG
ncbi:LLM class F420-dependent oxidoreductase [Caldovatus sediminis]|uniref:LLM class F420-dependent oxidoreductase n=1 Tax=Caldovatus sediminis TaxID=2041189 RepID=A0A8J2ZAY1_9PROT|nr:LLM class F420-dependent oxidoreductase [Caldovatus sediminis]GGG28664.1 LLM class F420-dependent oxidoreductase [Caldovatus sediminis]